jgi:hypothetical protein
MARCMGVPMRMSALLRTVGMGQVSNIVFPWYRASEGMSQGKGFKMVGELTIATSSHVFESV